MQMRAVALIVTVTVLSAAVPAACANDDPVGQLIRRAGNADSDEVRLALLKELRNRDDQEDSVWKDLDRLIAGIDRFSAEIFHFGRQNRHMGAEFYLLKSGRYVLTLAVQGATKPMQTKEFTMTGPRHRADFLVPRGRRCLLRVKRL